MTTRSSKLSLLVPLLLLLAACGGAESAGSDPSTAASEPAAGAASAGSGASADPGAAAATFPATVSAANGEVTITERPERIVSLSPTATEMLFAIGAGDQVVAADDQSDYPEGVPTTDLSGYTPNVEAVAGYEPDLVVVSDDSGEEDGIAAALGELGIPVLVHPAAPDLDAAYTQIEQLGVATGHVGDAAEVVAEMQQGIDEALAGAPDFDDEAPAIYHELDPTYYSATSDTFIGSIYEEFGVENIADAAAEASDYPQLSAEYIVEADPDVIFLADQECCDVTPASVAERPGWGTITAVEEDAVVAVDEDIASRWGPRIVEFAASVGEALEAVEPAPTG